MKSVEKRPSNEKPGWETPGKVDFREEIWLTPAKEFRLSKISLGASGDNFIEQSGPEILLASEGKIEIAVEPIGAVANSKKTGDTSRSRVELVPGMSAYVPAACSGYSISGAGAAFRAATNAEEGE